jgi:hypothetical protein
MTGPKTRGILKKVRAGIELAGVAELADARDSKSRILHWV